MPSDEERQPDHADAPSPGDPLPEIEDASVPEIEDASVPETMSPETVEEDDPQLLDSETRSLQHPTAESGDAESFADEASERTSRAAAQDDTSDAGAFTEEPKTELTSEPTRTDGNWERERSAQHVAIELREIEVEVRKLLEDRDTKRKRKLAGTRRWLELEEDIVSWRHGGRMEEAVLRRLLELIRKRHYLFHHLSFVAGTTSPRRV